jgi:hypothetical protein
MYPKNSFMKSNLHWKRLLRTNTLAYVEVHYSEAFLFIITHFKFDIFGDESLVELYF